jgi:peptidyl-prolyl cis-trans isomerase C
LLDANPMKYAPGSRLSFDQLYFDSQNSGAVNLALRKLESGQDWQTLGAAISVPKSMDLASREEIAKIFGEQFADSVQKLRPNNWTGPIQSGFGVHIVRIKAVKAGVPAKLRDVRRSVENDWRAATIREREEAAYQALLDGYTIKIAAP